MHGPISQRILHRGTSFVCRFSFERRRDCAQRKSGKENGSLLRSVLFKPARKIVWLAGRQAGKQVVMAT